MLPDLNCCAGCHETHTAAAAVPAAWHDVTAAVVAADAAGAEACMRTCQVEATRQHSMGRRVGVMQPCWGLHVEGSCLVAGQAADCGIW